jgi:hypothetical protein
MGQWAVMTSSGISMTLIKPESRRRFLSAAETPSISGRLSAAFPVNVETRTLPKSQPWDANDMTQITHLAADNAQDVPKMSHCATDYKSVLCRSA